jgi:hypothetical protein
VHISHDDCLEIAVLKGEMGEVQHFADDGDCPARRASWSFALLNGFRRAYAALKDDTVLKIFIVVYQQLINHINYTLSPPPGFPIMALI